MGHSAGFDKYVSDALFGSIIYPIYLEFNPKDNIGLYVCTILWYEKGKGLDDCR